MAINFGGDSGFDGGGYDGEETFSAGAIWGPLVGAVAGILTWGILAYFFKLELGWVAWAVGGLIGLGARVGGGSGGIETGIYCVILTVLIVGAGRVGVVKLVPASFVRDAALERLDEYTYNTRMDESRSYSRLITSDDEAVRAWMFANGYSKAESAEAITDEELEAFRSGTGYQLEQWARTSPEFEDWRNELADQAVKAANAVTLKEALFGSVSRFDVMFFLLGIATAFTLGGRLKA